MPSPPPAGTGALPGGRSRRSTALDDYVGLPATEAIEAARAAGLRPAPERVEASECGQDGLVTSQEPVAGSPAPPDGVLTLFVAEASADQPSADPDSAPQVATEAVEFAADERPPANWELDDLDAGPAEEPIFGVPAARAEPVAEESPAEPPSASRQKKSRLRRALAAVTGLAAVLTFTVAALSGHRTRQPSLRPDPPAAQAPAPGSSQSRADRARTARPRRSPARAEDQRPRRLRRARKRGQIRERPLAAPAITPLRSEPSPPPVYPRRDSQRDEFF